MNDIPAGGVRTPRKDTKPWLSFQEQKLKLESRGLIGTEKLLADLQHYGYYRLSGYWYIFRENSASNSISKKLSEFKLDTNYDLIHNLVEFDEKLRKAVFALVTDFELSVRTRVAYIMGKSDPLCYKKREKLAETVKENDLKEFLNKVETSTKRSKETFVKHYKDKYHNEFPIWVLAETLSFGQLCKLFELANQEDKKKISKHFGVSDTEYFHSLIISIGELRNVCAHHCRLWNRAFGKFPKSVKGISKLNHLETAKKDQCKIRRGGLFILLSLLLYMLDCINQTEKVRSLIQSIESFPKQNGLKITKMGFPKNWKEFYPWDIFYNL